MESSLAIFCSTERNARNTEAVLKPKHLRLELAAICQLKCPSCPTGRGENKTSEVGAGFLSLALFEKILSENPWIEKIEMSNWGEIFLHKGVVDIFRAAQARGVVLHASNGVNLNHASEEALEACVKYRVEHLTCSLDGASSATYAQYRRGGDWRQVLKNIERINFYKNKYRSRLPRLTWQFVVFGHNEHEIAVARDMARARGMEFRPKLSWDESFSPLREPQSVKQQTGLAAVSRQEYKAQTQKNYVRSVCLQLWAEPQINFDGKVLGCCVNTWGHFGHVAEGGLLAAINSEKMRYARQMLRGQAPQRPDIPCSTCSKFLDMQRAQQWIGAQEIRRAQGRFSLAYYWEGLQKRWRRLVG